MPIFTVEAIDTKGKRIRAEIDAASPNEAISKLKARGFKPTKINQKAESPDEGPGAVEDPSGGMMPEPAGAPAAGGKKAKKGGKSINLGKVKHSQLTQFTNQLSVLMDAGLPIVRALKILSQQMKPCMLKDFVSDRLLKENKLLDEICPLSKRKKIVEGHIKKALPFSFDERR
ncbi:MAG: hypothetical protein QF645_10595, partial [Planctomycetota bacterium]|nr:hypothetical protein [Planctomycetota bacterium]